MWDSACSVIICEQSHGSGAVICKHHLYSAPSLIHRAGLHRLRALFTPDKYERDEARLRRRIDKLDALRPERVTARHMCFAQMARAAVADVAVADQYSACQDAMQEHARAWETLDVGQQVVLEARARRLQISRGLNAYLYFVWGLLMKHKLEAYRQSLVMAISLSQTLIFDCLSFFTAERVVDDPFLSV